MNPGRSPWLARAAAGGALLVGFVLVLVVLFGDGSGRQYHLLFENGGQLVSGNQVLRAGQPIGTVDDVTLTDSGQAEVTISVDERASSRNVGDHPRHLAVGDREPLRLDRAGPEQRRGARGRSDAGG